MTEREKNEDCKQKHLILVAPLDWGMGHTIRCIPLIRAFLNEGCEVAVACNSSQSDILRQEIPALSTVFLPGWGIRYGRSWTATKWKLLLQGPKILTQIKAENRWLRDFVAAHHVSAVISDNRYGLQAAGIPSVLLTHQLAVRTGLGNWADRLVNRFLRRRLGRFNECWIPDEKTAPGMAGGLSHPPAVPPVPIRYIGCLSRFEAFEAVVPSDQQPGLLVMLSGPEPQRSILEYKVIAGLEKTTLPAVVVRGCPGGEVPAPQVPGHVTLIDYAGAAQLNTLVCSADLVLCRSGYTSIMDLVRLGKKMILVPTPGQAEQEYLAQHLVQLGLAIAVAQEQFDLETLLQRAAVFPFKQMTVDSSLHRKVIHDFVASLS